MVGVLYSTSNVGRSPSPRQSGRLEKKKKPGTDHQKGERPSEKGTKQGISALDWRWWRGAITITLLGTLLGLVPALRYTGTKA